MLTKQKIISDIYPIFSKNTVNLAPKRAKVSYPNHFFRRSAILLGVIGLAISFSPYTVSRLVTTAQDIPIFSDDPNYQQAEEQLLDLYQQEAQIVEELAALEAGTENENMGKTEGASFFETQLSSNLETAPMVDNSISIETDSLRTKEPKETEKPKEKEEEASLEKGTVFDPAVASGKVQLRLLATDQQTPVEEVVLEFVGVGGRIFSAKTDKSGLIFLELTSGRYYGRISSANSNYSFQGTNPAFFLNANEGKNLGTFYLEKK